MGRKGPLAERLHSRIARDSESGCWVFTGHKNRGGYGQIGDGTGRTVPAHRASYELHVGPIPEGMQIDHLCRNRACVNPEHLEPVTFAENVARGKIGELARRTHCSQGHDYATHGGFARSGRRICRTCRLAYQRANRGRWPQRTREQWAPGGPATRWVAAAETADAVLSLLATSDASLSLLQIAALLGISDSTAGRAITRLREEGKIRLLERGRSPGKPSRYEIVWGL